MADTTAARAARDAAQAAVSAYRALIRAGTIAGDDLRTLTRVRDDATRQLRAAERGYESRQAYRRTRRDYRAEETQRRARVREQTGFQNRYQLYKARRIAEANMWASYRYAAQDKALDAGLATLWVQNFTVGATLNDTNATGRSRFIEATDRFSWRAWRDEYDRKSSVGIVRVQYDTGQRPSVGPAFGLRRRSE